MWRWAIQVSSPASVLMVNRPPAPSQNDENGFCEPPLPLLMGGSRNLTGDSRVPSSTCFQNPSIDHLVAVILKYPRREESGRRESLNPGPIACAIQDLVSGLRRSPLLGIRVNKPLIYALHSFGWHHAHGVGTLEERRLARRNLYVRREEQSPGPPLPASAC
jgi:hypothetical protein